MKLMTSEDAGQTARCLLVVLLAAAIIVGIAFANATPARGAEFLPHPQGCPAKRFCGCGASVKVFGKSVRELWPSTAWLQFRRAAPGHMMVAVRAGHVFVIDYMLDNKTAMAWDFNSGRNRSRYHARSIAGYAIVDPHATYAAAKAAE